MIIAVDFDGVLCENAFPEIGKPKYEIISCIQQLIDKGHEVILWTTRNGEELNRAVDWCGYYGLHFNNINGPATSNEAEYKNKYLVQSRKVYADIYIDDHNLEYVMSSDRVTTPHMHMLTKLKRGIQTWKTEEN